MERFQPLIGLLLIGLIAYSLSTNRRAIRVRTIVWGFGLQLLFALIVLKTSIGQTTFSVRPSLAPATSAMDNCWNGTPGWASCQTITQKIVSAPSTLEWELDVALPELVDFEGKRVDRVTSSVARVVSLMKKARPEQAEFFEHLARAFFTHLPRA